MASTPPLNIVFFGSFQAYSADILSGLINSELLHVAAVVTTPPHPDKSGESIKNPVQVLAEQHGVPVLTPSSLDEHALQELSDAAGEYAYFVTAGYGKLLPTAWLTQPPKGALNLHFSLLPKYRGANPAEWALLLGETETGVTLIEMSPEFDTGAIIAQASLTIETDDTRESLYQKLYQLGAAVLPTMLAHYAAFQDHSSASTENNQDITFVLPPQVQPASPTPYAKRFKREDAFVDWAVIQSAVAGNGNNLTPESYQGLLKTAAQVAPVISNAEFLSRAVKALAGYPELWTSIPTIKGQKRMKILKARVEQHNLVLEQVQIEGQQPATWNQVKNQVIPD